MPVHLHILGIMHPVSRMRGAKNYRREREVRREKDRERERERERERDREGGGATDRQTDRQTERERERREGGGERDRDESCRAVRYVTTVRFLNSVVRCSQLSRPPPPPPLSFSPSLSLFVFLSVCLSVSLSLSLSLSELGQYVWKIWHKFCKPSHGDSKKTGSDLML